MESIYHVCLADIVLNGLAGFVVLLIGCLCLTEFLDAREKRRERRERDRQGRDGLGIS